MQLPVCAVGQVKEREVRKFLHEVRFKVRSGAGLDNDAVQKAYEAGCFCLSQL